MGSATTASGPRATAMGDGTTASDFSAVAMGGLTTASGIRATAMGLRTTAATDHSLSTGQCNDNNLAPGNSLFVVGNGNISPGGACSSRSNALVLERSGDLSIGGVFEAGPTGNTFAGHFQGDKNGTAIGNPSAHVALVENTNTGSEADGLAIQADPNSNPPTGVNYLSFYDGDDTDVGGIEGNGSGGVNLNTSGADYAEELPVATGASVPEPKALVGVRGWSCSIFRAPRSHIVLAIFWWSSS